MKVEIVDQSEPITLVNIISLTVSLLSFFVAALVAGWTIYRDAIRKPKFRVSISVRILIGSRGQVGERFLSVAALNLGPLPNRINNLWMKPTAYDHIKYGKRHAAFVTADFTHAANTPVGTKIEVGDTADLVFPYNADCFLSEKMSKIGVMDGYGNLHWIPRRQVKEIKKKFKEDFGVWETPSVQ